MVTEQNKTLEALQIAIQMEIDGKDFYLKSGQQSSNELGKKLLQSLAAEEDFHLQRFMEIYEAVRNKKAWPAAPVHSDGGKVLKTIFAGATTELSSNLNVLTTELDAIQTAMDMENKSYDFYKSQEGKAAYDAERDFYQSVAAQESHHYLVLLDYYEYLKDPAGWFAQKEHTSLDGG